MHRSKPLIRCLSLAFAWSVACAASAAAPVHCPAGIILPERLEQSRQLRAKYFAACLTCEGTRCRFREFKPDEDVFARQCPMLFCTPVSIGRSAILPEHANEEGVFSFTYAINADGRVSEVAVTSITGDTPSKVARDLIRSAFGRRIYDPIVIDGVNYALYNLEDGLNFTIER